MSDFSDIAWLVPFFPLLGACVAVLGPRRVRAAGPHPGGRGDRPGVPGLARSALLGQPRQDRLP